MSNQNGMSSLNIKVVEEHSWLCEVNCSIIWREARFDHFVGSYTPVPGTMIGAMLEKCNLRVSDLAEDKAEDLRKHFYCWWSKPLPDHLPFRWHIRLRDRRVWCCCNIMSLLGPQTTTCNRLGRCDNHHPCNMIRILGLITWKAC